MNPWIAEAAVRIAPPVGSGAVPPGRCIKIISTGRKKSRRLTGSITQDLSADKIGTGGGTMPHVEIKCYPGRTEEQKKACATKIAEDIAQTLGCGLESVSVAIKEVQQADWKKDVWEAQIVADKELLYKEPGYTCE